MEAEGFVEVGVFQDVEDGGEGFVFDGIGLGGDFDQGGADVEGVWIFGSVAVLGADAVASGDGGAGGCGLLRGLCAWLERRARR